MSSLKKFLFKNTTATQTVAKNTLWLFIGEGVSRVIKIALIIFGARMLGVQEWGIFSYGLSIALVFSFFSDMGLHTLAAREFSFAPHNRRNDYIYSSIFLKYLLLLCTYVCIVVFFCISTKISVTSHLIFWIAIFTVVDSFKDFLFGIIRAHEKMEAEAAIKIAANIATASIGVFVLYRFHSAASLVAAYAIGSTAAVALVMIFFGRYVKTDLKQRPTRALKNIWKEMIPFGLLLFSTTVIFNIDTVVVGWLQGSYSLGIYAAGQRLIQIMYMVPYLISLALLPSMIKDPSSQSTQFNIILSALIGFSFPIVIIGIAIAPSIVHIAFGESFKASVPIFSILLTSIIAVFPLHLINNSVIAKQKQWNYIYSHLCTVVLNIVLIYFLTKYFHTIGAAIATTISLLTLTITGWFVADIETRPIMEQLKKYVIAALCMIVIVFVTPRRVHLWIPVVLSMVVYISVLISYKEPFFYKGMMFFKRRYFLK